MMNPWWLNAWRSWWKVLLASLAGMVLVRSTLVDLNRVGSASMMPSLLPGDRVLVNRLAYGLKVPLTRYWILSWGNPRRGDVVVFDAPVAERLFVKRVVGVPGDTVVVLNGQLWLNGNLAQENPFDLSRGVKQVGTPADWLVLSERVGERCYRVQFPIIIGEDSFGPVTVPPDCYFVLGDNREGSKDSRWFGFVERRRILGQTQLILFSLNPANQHCPRWQRCFARLF